MSNESSRKLPPLTTDVKLIDTAPRALVYLTVEWSIPERLSRNVLYDAITLLSEIHLQLFIISEDDPENLNWLAAHGWHKNPMGSGSILWFEQGKCVATELMLGHRSALEIVERTIAIWKISEVP